MCCEVKTDPADVSPDMEKTSALTTYGRDEKYIENKLHLLGASSVILHGVGDGMIPYCCLKQKIPCLLIYGTGAGGQVHQKTIEKFLVGKVARLMEEAVPGDVWYETNFQLGCPDKPMKMRKQKPMKKFMRTVKTMRPEQTEGPMRKKAKSRSSSSSTTVCCSTKQSPNKKNLGRHEKTKKPMKTMKSMKAKPEKCMKRSMKTMKPVKPMRKKAKSRNISSSSSSSWV